MDTICSKCGKIAQGYEDIGYTMIDGALYCPDCVPEIKPEWIRDVRNGSMFYDMEPDMYYTSIEELCKEWGANPDDLKFKGRIKIEILWPKGNSPWDNYIGHFFKKGGKKRNERETWRLLE